MAQLSPAPPVSGKRDRRAAFAVDGEGARDGHAPGACAVVVVVAKLGGVAGGLGELVVGGDDPRPSPMPQPFFLKSRRSPLSMIRHRPPTFTTCSTFL